MQERIAVVADCKLVPGDRGLSFKIKEIGMFMAYFFSTHNL